MAFTEQESLEMRAAKAQRARRELEVLKPRLDALRAGYVKAWANSTGGQTQEREQLWLAYAAIDAIEAQFRAEAGDEAAARAQLEAA